jgi:hypothetical protein
MSDNEVSLMSIKDVSGILGVDPEAIKKHVREMYPDLMKNGVTTYLDEKQVTEIKKHMLPTTEVVGSVTSLEMKEKTLEVISWLTQSIIQERVLRQKAEGEVKMLVHDFNKEYTTTEIAKELHLRSARELNDKLSEMKIQFKQNGTWVLYSDYSGEHYTSIKNTVLDSGKVVYDRLCTGLGRKFIIGLFGVEAKDNVN